MNDGMFAAQKAEAGESWRKGQVRFGITKPMRSSKLLIFIPTYNEAENVGAPLPGIE